MPSLPYERTQLQSHPPDIPAQPDTGREKERHWEGEGERKSDREREQGTEATESVQCTVRSEQSRPKSSLSVLWFPENVNTLGT